MLEQYKEMTELEMTSIEIDDYILFCNIKYC